MKNYITFGQIHVHSVNGKTFDKDCVAVIEAETAEQGRDKAFEFFDGVFHRCIPESEWQPEMLEYFPRGLISV